MDAIFLKDLQRLKVMLKQELNGGTLKEKNFSSEYFRQNRNVISVYSLNYFISY